jgi:hypothetical protein
MGNVCCKPKKKPKKEAPVKDSDRPLDRTQSIFVKSKVDKFKKHTNLVPTHNSMNPGFSNNKLLNLDNISSSDSDLEPKLQSAESSLIDISRLSASRASVVSRSVSASHTGFDNFHLVKQDQFKKGKILD